MRIRRLSILPTLALTSAWVAPAVLRPRSTRPAATQANAADTTLALLFDCGEDAHATPEVVGTDECVRAQTAFLRTRNATATG